MASVASCYALTLDALAQRREVPLAEVEIEGVGHVTKRAEGRLGFVVIELRVQLSVAAGLEQGAEQVAHDAHRACLVGHALEIPIELELEVRTKEQPRHLVCADAVTAVLAGR